MKKLIALTKEENEKLTSIRQATKDAYKHWGDMIHIEAAAFTEIVRKQQPDYVQPYFCHDAFEILDGNLVVLK